MAQKHKPRYQSNNNEFNSAPLVVGLVAVMAVIVLFSVGLRLFLNSDSPAPQVSAETEAAMEVTEAPEIEATEAPAQEERPSLWQRLFGRKQETEPTEPEIPEPEHVVSQATISVTGDILMHMPVINTGLTDSGSYNFDSIFRYLLPDSSAADLAVANLETTLCGTEGGYKYSGYPAFNCPDEIVDALKNAGFDMLLTANNHCYDTGEYGFLRTVRTIRNKGLSVLGTTAAVDEPKYIVRDINGIKVGMVSYTYEGQPENPTPGKIYMNRNALSDTCSVLINSFLSTQTDPFFLELQTVLGKMKQEGAEATIMFIHWGTEYQTTPSAEQTNIAQQLCDLGFDVIVGGHPHVIQPVSLLTSRLEPEHKTVCLYSTGNAVSNQRISEMDLKTGHTEDGLLFSVTFSKYSDGTVYLEGADLLPFWVDLRTEGSRSYNIIPLHEDLMGQWATLYDMTEEAAANAQKSYDRTVALTGTGMAEVKQYLADQTAQREADYLAAVTAPQQAA